MWILRWFRIENVREFFWSSFFLVTALLLAILSQIAQQNGERYAAAFLAILSLTFAVIVCTLVPKLVMRLKLDFLSSLQFLRFTQRGAFFILITLIITLSTLNTGNNLLILILSVLLASLIVSGLLSNLVLQGLKISLTIPNSIHARQKAVFFLSLRNLKRLVPSFALKLKGRKKDGGYYSGETDFFTQEKYFPYLQAGERWRVKLSCEFSRRGRYSVDGFEVTTTFPFGFFARGRSLEAQGDLVVYPALYDLSPLLLRYPGLQGLLEDNCKGPGSTLYKIRDYQVGDSARFVHWKSTAKVARLMIKDFAHEEENPIQVDFSTYLPERSARALEQFEKAVSYIASLAYYCRRKGRSFHFSSGEFQVVLNGREEDITALMGYLSQVEPSDQVQVKMHRLRTPYILFAANQSTSTQKIQLVNYLQL